MKLPTLPKMPRAEGPWLTIGEYSISTFGKTGDYWIEHDSGEGMQVSRSRMEKLIADFYKENF